MFQAEQHAQHTRGGLGNGVECAREGARVLPEVLLLMRLPLPCFVGCRRPEVALVEGREAGDRHISMALPAWTTANAHSLTEAAASMMCCRGQRKHSVVSRGHQPHDQTRFPQSSCHASITVSPGPRIFTQCVASALAAALRSHLHATVWREP